MTSRAGVVRSLVAACRRRSRHRHARTLVKTAGYRGLMVLITIAVAFAVTEDVGSAVDIGIVTNAVKTGTYYGYERLWSRVSWGLGDDG